MFWPEKKNDESSTSEDNDHDILKSVASVNAALAKEGSEQIKNAAIYRLKYIKKIKNPFFKFISATLSPISGWNDFLTLSKLVLMALDLSLYSSAFSLLGTKFGK